MGYKSLMKQIHKIPKKETRQKLFMSEVHGNILK